MSLEAAVSVPGKTILFGEHAAVYGHAALVAALDHRMSVNVRISPGAGEIRLTMPGHGPTVTVSVKEAEALVREADAAWSDAFERGDGSTFHPVDTPGRLALLAAARALDDAGRSGRDVSISVVSSIPTGAGFGSSAALAVGVTAACRRAAGCDDTVDDLARFALAVERHQHGRPSGVDVQAVLRGGALWCRRDGDRLAHEEIAFPAGALATLRLYDSGRPAESTGEMVAAVRRLAAAQPERTRDAFDAMEAAARAGRAALERGDGDALVPIVRRAHAALDAIGVVHPDVARAVAAIEAQGGAAKVSGAGGRTGAGSGLVLVAHPDPSWHARFAPPASWQEHSVALGAPGLREEVAA